MQYGSREEFCTRVETISLQIAQKLSIMRQISSKLLVCIEFILVKGGGWFADFI